MKLQKRFAAVLLCAVMALAALTACSGGPTPTKLEWSNSRTKQYFDAKGVTPQEFTLTASMSVSGVKTNLKFAVKGKRAGYELGSQDGLKTHVDENGDVYQWYSEGTKWHKYPAGSPSAESYADSTRACYGYFVLPDAESIGSIAAGEYKDGSKVYYTETIKLHQNGVYATYTYCFEGSELSCILMESANGMMNNIELKPIADEAVIEIPSADRVVTN